MKTMKNLTLKLAALLLVFFFAAHGVFAQNPADFVDAATEANTSYMTVGTTMPFYAVPDSYYHPTWTAFSTNLTADFTWNWTSAAFGTELTLASQADNYVTITGNTVGGPYAVNVKEQAPGDFGGCEDPTGTNINIIVVDAPEIVSFPYFAGLTPPLAPGGTYQQCGPMVDINPSIQITGFPNFQVRFNLVRQEINAIGGDVGLPTTLVDATVPANWFAGGPGNALVRGTHTVVFDVDRTLSLVGGTQRTKYTYTITGITDNISRKSDYLTAKTWYDNASRVFELIVNPAPDTGPIFHIPNTFGNL